MDERAWRWAVPAGVAAAALGVLGDAYHLYWTFATDAERSDLLGTLPYRAHGILIAVAYALALFSLAGLASGHGARLPRVGWAGVAVAYVGTTLVAGDYWAESAVVPAVVAPQPLLADAGPAGGDLGIVIAAFALMAIGWIAFASAALRARLLPRAPLVALLLGAVLAFTPLPGSNLLLFGALGWTALASKRAGHPTA